VSGATSWRQIASEQRTFPFPLRLLLAAEPRVLSEVLSVVQRGISTFLIRRSGHTVASGARTGALTLIQRFGSALNLNPHLGNCSCVALPPASLQSCTCCFWTGPTHSGAAGPSSTVRGGRNGTTSSVCCTVSVAASRACWSGAACWLPITIARAWSSKQVPVSIIFGWQFTSLDKTSFLKCDVYDSGNGSCELNGEEGQNFRFEISDFNGSIALGNLDTPHFETAAEAVLLRSAFELPD